LFDNLTNLLITPATYVNRLDRISGAERPYTAEYIFWVVERIAGQGWLSMQSAIHARARWLRRSGMVAITGSGKIYVLKELVERVENDGGDIS